MIRASKMYSSERHLTDTQPYRDTSLTGFGQGFYIYCRCDLKSTIKFVTQL